jgi:DNA-binding transcriptional ArsR family regulator
VGTCPRNTPEPPECPSGGERAEYIRDALNLNLVRTSEYVKPYNSPDHVNTEQDAALLEAIEEKHDDRPSLITTTTAEHEYDNEGVLELVDETKHYGNVLGSNEFDDVRLGVVIGSNHYGDGYIKKWGAYASEAVERGDGRGTDLSYGEFGDRVLAHMREHDTLQAAMRFGRDGNGAVVYVHTDTLPEWVPLAGEGRVLTTWSVGMREVIDAAADLEEWRTDEIARRVSITERQVRKHLHTLRKRGYLEAHHEGRGFTWHETGLHRVSNHGEVALEPIDVEDMSETEVAEVARNSIYTWEFRNPQLEHRGDVRSTHTNGGNAIIWAGQEPEKGGPPPG